LALNYDITSRDWDNTDVNVNITDPDGFNGIIDVDNDNASFSEGTLTDVEVVNDNLQLKQFDYFSGYEDSKNLEGRSSDISPTTDISTYKEGLGRNGGTSIAVEPSTTNLIDPTSIRGTRNISLNYIGIESGYYKYGISGTWSSGTYPYCMALPSVSFTGGVRYSAFIQYYTNVPEKFNHKIDAIKYVNEPLDYGERNFTTDLPNGDRLVQAMGFAYTSTTIQNGYLNMRPVSDGTSFNPDTDFIYFKKAQIEERAFCTSFVDGSRSSGQLKYPITIPKDNFTINLWAKWDWDTSLLPDRTVRLLQINDYYVNNSITIMRWKTDPSLGTWQKDSSGVWETQDICDIDNNSFQWNMITIKKDGNELSFYHNGSLSSTRILSNDFDTDIPYLALGYYGVSNETGFIYDELMIEKKAISDSQIQKIYNQQLPAKRMDNGTRQAPQLDLSAVNDVASSSISWKYYPYQANFDIINLTDEWIIELGNPSLSTTSEDGNKSVYFPGDGAYHRIKSNYRFNVEEGEEYKCRIRAKGDAGTSSMYVGLTANNNQNYRYFSNMSYVNVGESWTTYEGRLTIPAGITEVGIWIFNYVNNTGALWVDDITITKTSVVNSVDENLLTTIKTSIDNGSTWQTATNGGAIPNLPANPTTLDVRQTLDTNDTTLTPVLESLEVQIETPIKYKWSLDTTNPNTWETFTSNPLTQSQDGQWYLYTKAFNSDNQVVIDRQGTYDIDKTQPDVPNVNLINNTSHSFSLEWTNSDSLSGVDYVELYTEESDGSLNYVADIDIDGDSNTEPSIQLSNTDTSYTVDGLSEYTNYRYKVRVFDKAGNFSEDTYAEMITDDITEPIVGYSLNSRDWLNTNVDEVINVDDQAGSGVAEAWYKWTNSAVQPTDGWIVMGTTTNFATSQSQEGEWYLHIKATDNYNNTAYDYSGPYKIDKTAPVINSTNITIDSPTGVYDTYTATIEWFIEDQQDLSGVDRTEIGFYVDGIWHYDENTLPDGITTNTDMDNITGGGSKTAIFSNVPREIDIAASFNGYDIATNETGEQQISSIFTPRIYASHTLTGLSDYEMGINSDYKSETKYETGINKNYQSPSSQIIDVLSKSYDSPTLYEIGKRTNYKSQTLYEAGINKTEGPAPSLQDILVLYDEPILVSGKFSQGIRLGLSDLEIDISDFTEWTMHVFRRGIDDSEFRTIFINSDGEVYVDNEINNKYDVSWFESTNDKITIKSGAIDIDELLVFPQIIDQKQIDRIGGSPFYDPNRSVKIDMPDSVDMEVMQ
jgi:hypothetical protein